jgi:uncharacterized protein
MKSTPVIISLFLFLSFSSYAQHTVLWKITNAGNIHISYLFGTYHLSGNSFIDSFPIIEEKIRSTDMIITETAFDKEEAKKYYETRQATDNLSQILSKEDIQLVNTILKNKVDVFKLTPGELSAYLVTNYQNHVCQSNNKDSMLADPYIQYLGNKNGKQYLYLEKNQLEVLTRLTSSYTWDQAKKEVPEILNKYKRGSYDPTLCFQAKKYLSLDLEYSFKQSCSGTMEERNNNWIKQLLPLLTDKNCFISVGFAHLFYKCGLIQQLRKAGYTIEELKL